MQCEFLQTHPSGSAAALSPCALKVAISDMSQFMTAFSHIYNTDFKGYCQKAPPALSSSTNVFQSVHQLLHTCNTVMFYTMLLDLWLTCLRHFPALSVEKWRKLWTISMQIFLFSIPQELAALKQLSETSLSLTQTVKELQTDKCYWSRGEKHTLRKFCTALQRGGFFLDDLHTRYWPFSSFNQNLNCS